ncbi:conserved Plasmodium protein, unknown function [Plasmodium reichenowi]|uniref:Uncharacterized protein n=1 Tax=Plasmodium reichenowi TaxID=5854 RepID=A0A060RVN6_PLARE|nr:conserved Plasmodium protein, unknown function [Plasmodium reichenowi]
MSLNYGLDEIIQIKCSYIIEKYKNKLKKLKEYKHALKEEYEKKNKAHYVNRYMFNKEKEQIFKDIHKYKEKYELETSEKIKEKYNNYFADIFLYEQEYYQCIYKVFKNLLLKKEEIDEKEKQVIKLYEYAHMMLSDKNINVEFENFENTNKKTFSLYDIKTYEYKKKIDNIDNADNLENLYNINVNEIYESILLDQNDDNYTYMLNTNKSFNKLKGEYDEIKHIPQNNNNNNNNNIMFTSNFDEYNYSMNDINPISTISQVKIMDHINKEDMVNNIDKNDNTNKSDIVINYVNQNVHQSGIDIQQNNISEKREASNDNETYIKNKKPKENKSEEIITNSTEDFDMQENVEHENMKSEINNHIRNNLKDNNIFKKDTSYEEINIEKGDENIFPQNDDEKVQQSKFLKKSVSTTNEVLGNDIYNSHILNNSHDINSNIKYGKSENYINTLDLQKLHRDIINNVEANREAKSETHKKLEELDDIIENNIDFNISSYFSGNFDDIINKEDLLENEKSNILNENSLIINNDQTIEYVNNQNINSKPSSITKTENLDIYNNNDEEYQYIKMYNENNNQIQSSLFQTFNNFKNDYNIQIERMNTFENYAQEINILENYEHIMNSLNLDNTLIQNKNNKSDENAMLNITNIHDIINYMSNHITKN